MKTIRYRVTHNGQEYWHTVAPTDDKLSQYENYIAQWGGSCKVEQVITTIRPDTPWGCGKLESETTEIFYIEG